MFRISSKYFLGGFLGASTVLARGVSRRLLGCCQCVSRVFLRCFAALLGCF